VPYDRRNCHVLPLNFKKSLIEFDCQFTLENPAQGASMTSAVNSQLDSRAGGPVAVLVGIDGGVVSGVMNLESRVINQSISNCIFS
jgi:hypothetical protein